MPDLRAECLAMAETLGQRPIYTEKEVEAAALLRRVADALPGETEDWQPIETALPAQPMMVLLYSAHLMLTDMADQKISPQIEPGRDEAFSLGFWDGVSWCELGTGHEVFEWAGSEGYPIENYPTHWHPLPAPPTRAESAPVAAPSIRQPNPAGRAALAEDKTEDGE